MLSVKTFATIEEAGQSLWDNRLSLPDKFWMSKDSRDRFDFWQHKDSAVSEGSKGIWKFEKVSEGVYRRKNLGTEKVLTLDGPVFWKHLCEEC